MNGWILSVFAAVLLVTLISLLLPEGKLAAFVKPFISAVLILIIIAPIINAEFLTESQISDEQGITINQNFLDYVNTAKIDAYTQNCIKIAENYGVTGSIAEIEYIKKADGAVAVIGVSINLKNAVITSQDEHIVILQRLKNALSAYLGINEMGVKFYE